MRIKILENIQILLFKENIELLKKLNFENDDTFSEPLILTYFNTKNNKSLSKEVLEELMQGYFTKKEPLKINHSFGKGSLAYLPELGYLISQDKRFRSVILLKTHKLSCCTDHSSCLI